jgi:hypothetical protein
VGGMRSQQRKCLPEAYFLIAGYQKKAAYNSLSLLNLQFSEQIPHIAANDTKRKKVTRTGEDLHFYFDVERIK